MESIINKEIEDKINCNNEYQVSNSNVLLSKILFTPQRLYKKLASATSIKSCDKNSNSPSKFDMVDNSDNDNDNFDDYNEFNNNDDEIDKYNNSENDKSKIGHQNSSSNFFRLERNKNNDIHNHNVLGEANTIESVDNIKKNDKESIQICNKNRKMTFSILRKLSVRNKMFFNLFPLDRKKDQFGIGKIGIDYRPSNEFYICENRNNGSLTCRSLMEKRRKDSYNYHDEIAAQYKYVSSKNFDNTANLNHQYYYSLILTIISFFFVLQYAVSSSWNIYESMSVFKVFLWIRLFFLILFLLAIIYKIKMQSFFEFPSIVKLEIVLLLLGYIEIFLSILAIFYKIDLLDVHVQNTFLVLLILQLLRLYRIVVFFENLSLFLKGVSHSLSSLRWTAFFVLVFIFGCSIFTTMAFRDESDDDLIELWGGVLRSMFTLFTILTLEGWNDISSKTAVKYPYSRIFFVLYICFTTLTLMNVVTGIILDAYVDVSQRLMAESDYMHQLKRKGAIERALKNAFRETDILEEEAKKKFGVFETQNFDSMVKKNKNFGCNCKDGISINPSSEKFKSFSDIKAYDKNNEAFDALNNDGAKKMYLNLKSYESAEILLHSSVQKALRNTEVPLYQAFDILSIYRSYGIERISVSEFSEACNKVANPSIGRQLLITHIAMQRNFDQVFEEINNLRTFLSENLPSKQID